eukprot:CAMPEP_0182418286 /NCGR_PEP_ID=MMETSP1167-20130531/2761_1 /TAXON_ID=2988 /ORGANISM="Mallomonas Sp, Strain CCMP3275" /LENGTH=853 /DNA_ID=CAMNT_0024592429 /DNA_START=51 /DNA_END=2612 /DNA_ORIENTATION=-
MDLSSTLQNARSPNPAIRNPAEQQLTQASEQQYDQFILALCVEFATEGKPESSRQLAGLYLKNLVVAQDETIQQDKTSKWLNCDGAIKQQIRTGFLQAILSPVQVASHTAAQVIAAFGAIDIPGGHWPDLLPTLFQNVSSAEVSLSSKVASLEALGYMCEIMNPDEIEKSVVDQLLNTIVDGMRSDRPNEMRMAAVAAMCNSLEFTAQNFEIQQERDTIMRVVCEATQCTDVNVRIKAFECIATVASLYYDKLPQYMEALFQLTATAIRTDDQLVGQQAIEFWSTICDDEIELIDMLEDGPQEGVTYLKVVEQAAPLLVPILLETLTKQDDTDSDESWNIAMAGATCIDAMSQTTKDQIVPLVLPFVQQNIESAEWRLKEAAIMAFGSIMNGPSQQTLTPIVAAALPVLIKCLADSKSIVRDTSAWTIGRVCEFQAMAIAPEMLPSLVAGLSGALDDPSSRVASQACFAVHNLAAACAAEADSASNVLSNFMPQMMTKLLTVTNREDWESDNLRSTAYEAANMMVTNSALDMKQIVLQVLGEALKRLEETFAMTADPQERMNLQSLLCGLIGVCVQKVSASDISEAMSDRIMQLILQVFTVKGAVAHEDAFMAVGYMIDKLGSNFSRYVEFFHSALLSGLKNVEEYQVCTVAVGVVGDLCRALGKKLIPLCDDIVRSLLDLLQSPALNRSVKPHVLSVFADIAMALETDFVRYANIILMMLQQAAEVNIQTDDEDLIDYINGLREAILEAYTGIIQGLSQNCDVIVPFLDRIVEFVQRCATDVHRSPQVLKAVIGLLGDMGHSFGSRMHGVLSMPFVPQLLQEGSQQDDSTRQLVQWTQSVVANLKPSTISFE